MKIYLVGGAVRDKLLHLPVKERDWVVVGTSVQHMLNQGYKQVGKEFPVFLHPKTNEEYALARMERKVTPGYKGFSFDTSPDVKLEDDLIRRDLTINAMAESADGQLIDPYHGKQDLENRLLRHVSPAFAEDPVRILRVGRFLARFAYLGFKVAPETITLMQQMVNAGEVNALVAERVWKELERALAEKNPEKFFEVLAASHALPILFPTITMDSQAIRALIEAAKLTPSAIIRFAALLHAMSAEEINALCNRYRVPNDYQQLAKLTAAHAAAALHAHQASAEALFELFAILDIYRREERFHDFLTACKAVAKANDQSFDERFLLRGAHAAKSVDVRKISSQLTNGNHIAEEIKRERLSALEIWLKKEHRKTAL